MKLINIGFGSVISAGRVLAVLSPEGKGSGFELDERMLGMLGGMTALRALNIMGAIGERPGRETLLALNKTLNGIKKQ